jgi:hypothetical protein
VLSAGNLIPADGLVIEAEDFLVKVVVANDPVEVNVDEIESG